MDDGKSRATGTLTLLCGLPASGKTTFARRLEAVGAVRLGSDDWMVPLFGHHLPREVFDSRLAVIKDLQWQLAVKILRAGVNVVLEDGFWTRQERQKYRAQAEALGAAVRLIYFDVPESELRRRLANRNANLPPGTFEINDEALELFLPKFEPPAPEEGALSPDCSGA